MECQVRCDSIEPRDLKKKKTSKPSLGAMLIMLSSNWMLKLENWRVWSLLDVCQGSWLLSFTADPRSTNLRCLNKLFGAIVILSSSLKSRHRCHRSGGILGILSPTEMSILESVV